MSATNTDIRKDLRDLLQTLCSKVSAYEHSYGQAREEAFADYGNCFSKTFGTIDAALKAPKTDVSPDEYATYYHAACLNGLRPLTFDEYVKHCKAMEKGGDSKT